MRHLSLALSLSLGAVSLGTVCLAAWPAAAFADAFKVIEGGAFNPEGGPIRYSLEPNGSADVDGDADLEALRASFRAWACVEGTSIRFEEDEEPGPAQLDDSDGKNTLFWDESGDECGMGPGTLGITTGGVGGTFRDQADICFNGRDSEWGVGTATDVESIALHEIGHMIGLDHPCDSDADPDSCLSPDDSVMFPSWSGINEREPRSSDVAGVVALYPLSDASGCEGPFSEGEKCGCNDECVDGLLCVPDAVGQLRCGQACTSADRECGPSATCVLDVPQDGGDAPGVCVAGVANKPAGAVCSQGPECASGTCQTVIDLGSSICLVVCDNDDDCAGGSCFDGRCLGGFESQECPVIEPPDDCACQSTGSSSPLTGAAALVLASFMLLRRDRRRCKATSPESCSASGQPTGDVAGASSSVPAAIRQRSGPVDEAPRSISPAVGTVDANTSLARLDVECRSGPQAKAE